MNDSVLTIPHDFEAEQVTLGAIIYDNKYINIVAPIITPNSFHAENHRHIFRAMLELVETGQPIDEILLGDQLKEFGKFEDIGGYGYLADLVDAVPSTINVPFWSKTIAEHASARDLISITSDISRKARDPQQSLTDLLIEAEKGIAEITKKNSQKSTVKIKNVIAESISKFQERTENKSETIGIPTGFYDIDKIISGLIAPNVITVAADSGVGKTTFALNVVENIYLKTDEKRATVFFSREMANFQLVDRLICSSGKVDSHSFKTGKVEDKDFNKIVFASDNLASKNILMNDELFTIDQMVHETKYLHKNIEGGLCFAVIDYLQLMEGVSKRNREQEISYISRSIKRLAKDINIPIMPLSQLNRDLRKRPNKRPIRSDLRESAAIEHDSDIILFLYREEFYNEETTEKGIAEVKIDKHRNGDTGLIFLNFRGEYNRFDNFSRYSQPPL